MRLLLSCFTLSLLLWSGVSIAGAQSAAPSAGSIGNEVSSSETFLSLEGRFTIALPSQCSGFQGVSFKTAGGPATGTAYNWRVNAVSYSVLYADVPPGGFAQHEPGEMLDYITKVTAAHLGDKGARLASEKSVSVSNFPGREVKIDFGSLGLVIARTYIVNKRLYQVMVRLPENRSAEQEDAANKALDSFKLITEDEVAAAMRKQISDATPEPLPQEPAAAKVKSDAEDQELKSKVKSVLIEEEDKSGRSETQGRKRSNLYEFNSDGNLTREVMYDYKGNPMDITVYGYIDGARVSNSKLIRHEYDPPPPMMSPSETVSKTRRDPRYFTKYEYQYDGQGNLTEERFYSNDGSLKYKEVRVIKGPDTEVLLYDDRGSLTGHRALVLDQKGQVVEETDFNERDGSIRDKYRYQYEFDSVGNWVTRTTEKLVTRDGKSDFAPGWVTHRRIEYY